MSNDVSYTDVKTVHSETITFIFCCALTQYDMYINKQMHLPGTSGSEQSGNSFLTQVGYWEKSVGPAKRQ